MTTQVNITVGGNGLQQQLSADVSANRFRQLNAARDNALAIKAQSANTAAAEPTIYTSPRSAPRPEPAATRQGYPVAVAWAYEWDPIYRSSQDSIQSPDQPLVWVPNRCPVTLFAENGSSVEVTFPQIASPHIELSQYAKEPFTTFMRADIGDTRYYAYHNFQRSFNFSLPIGPDTHIICLSASARTSWEFQRQLNGFYQTVEGSTSQTILLASDSIRSFFVSPTSLRELSVPTAFRNVLKDIEQADQSFNAFHPMNSSYYGGGCIGFNVGEYRPNYYGPSVALHSTPSIFSYLARYEDAPEAYLDVTNPNDDEAIVEYFNDNVYNYKGDWLKAFEHVYEDGERVIPTELDYPLQKRSLLAPYAFTSTRSNPKSKVTVPLSVTAAYNAYQDEYQGGPRTSLYSTWDWGNPAYCRQQLYALGFTNADLTP